MQIKVTIEQVSTTYKQKFTIPLKLELLPNYKLFASSIIKNKNKRKILKILEYIISRYFPNLKHSQEKKKKKIPPNNKIFLVIYHIISRKNSSISRVVDKTQNDVIYRRHISTYAGWIRSDSRCSNGRQKPLWPLSSPIIEYLIIQWEAGEIVSKLREPRTECF